MEHSLLCPHNVTLKEGIPYRLIHNLCRGRKYYDANLVSNYSTDDDIMEINRMESNLGRLTPEQEDFRVMADFCCIWRYDYPRRVHKICSIIGGSPDTELRLHYQVSPSRRRELGDYAEALKKWLMGDDCSENSGTTCKKVYRFLGNRDPLKSLLVERTYLGLSSRFLNCSFYGKITTGEPVCLQPCSAQPLPDNWMSRMTELEREIREKMGPESAPFLCEVGGAGEPACHFKFVRRVDILVSSIGVLKWRGNLPEKDGLITGRRKITQQYLRILESYWRGSSLDRKDGMDEKVKDEIFSLLGPSDDFKRWLVACLWKNIKNQTLFHAFPMKRWVEFVRIAEGYLNDIAG